MRIVFRIATRADLPLIVATYNATIAGRTATADLDPVSVESRESWFTSHGPSTRPLWVVEADGRYAGWMAFSSFYGRTAYNGTAEVSVYLENAYRGRGLGKKCLEHAIESAPRCGIHTLLGFVFAHNEGSLKLFAGAGFGRWALLPGVAVMDDIPRDLVIVGRKVKPTPPF